MKKPEKMMTGKLFRIQYLLKLTKVFSEHALSELDTYWKEKNAKPAGRSKASKNKPKVKK